MIFYKDDYIVLYKGDCLEIMPELDIIFDAVVCDLPFGTTACPWDTIIPFEPLWKCYENITRERASFVMNSSQPFTTKLISSKMNDFSHSWVWKKTESSGNPLLANKMPLKNFEDIIVFYKNNNAQDPELNHPLRFYTELLRKHTNYSRTKFRKIFGHYKFQHFMELQQQYSLCTKEVYAEITNKFNLKKESWFLEYKVLQEKDANTRVYKRVYNPQMEKGKSYNITSGRMGEAFGSKAGGFTTENNGQRFPKAIIEFGKDKEKLHPTQKPLALMEYLIRTYTNEGDLVLDNCAGSGTTGLACKNLNRKCVLIEREEKYCKIAVDRLKQEVLCV